MIINTNMMAMNTHRQLTVNSASQSKSTERLSSGMRINRAGDDAAGLAISEKMRAQVKGLSMASKNSQDAISLIQTAEGALNETHAILQRMRELSVQSASDTNVTEDRDALDKELKALQSELDDIAGKTTFNGKKLLNGDFGTTAVVDTANANNDIAAGVGGVLDITLEGFAAGNDQEITFTANGTDYEITFDGTTVTVAGNETDTAATLVADFGAGRVMTLELASSGHTADDFDNDSIIFDVTGSAAQIQTGSNHDESTALSIGAMDANTLGVHSSQVNITTQTDANEAIEDIDAAINTVSSERAGLGAMQNRLEHKIKNLDTSAENLQAAESRIRDLDMAKEMTAFTKNNILSQAATAMLAQANQAPQGVLSLLR